MEFERQKPVTDEYRENFDHVFLDALTVEGTLGIAFPKEVSARVIGSDPETQTIYLGYYPNSCPILPGEGEQ